VSQVPDVVVVVVVVVSVIFFNVVKISWTVLIVLY